MNRESFRALKERFWPPGKDQLLILALSGLLLAVAAVPTGKGKEEKSEARETEAEQTETTDYARAMEERLEELLSQVEGVGRVRVMLTLKGTGEKQVEKDVTTSQGSAQEETVFEEEGSSRRTPYVTGETNPQVEGLLVIAEGGDDGEVKAGIIDAAQALFGIEAHKIRIMKMEVEKAQ